LDEEMLGLPCGKPARQSYLIRPNPTEDEDENEDENDLGAASEDDWAGGELAIEPDV